MTPGRPGQSSQVLKPHQQGPLGIFFLFLKLGCIAFGGPVAHLGYFQERFVRRLKWLDGAEFADLLALCQFLPGPASSQMGFAIGYRRGGIAGAFAAWAGFTLPSALLMLAFAFGIASVGDLANTGWVVGLKLAAVAVVANAVWNLAQKLCPDTARGTIALGTAVLLVLLPGPGWQLFAILVGAMVGWLFFRGELTHAPERHRERKPGRSGLPWLATFALLLLGLPLVSAIVPFDWLRLAEGFYRAGALVFGGGHVVLPLLDAFTVAPGWITREAFLAGYGAAQALPGPLFAFSAFLGASVEIGPGGLIGGLLALFAIYLPAWCLVLGVLPYWERIRHLRPARAALMGTNAAVVGLLLAAFIDPVCASAVTGATRLGFARLGFALLAFILLRYLRLPPWALVLSCAGAGSFLFA